MLRAKISDYIAKTERTVEICTGDRLQETSRNFLNNKRIASNLFKSSDEARAIHLSPQNTGPFLNSNTEKILKTRKTNSTRRVDTECHNVTKNIQKVST